MIVALSSDTLYNLKNDVTFGQTWTCHKEGVLTLIKKNQVYMLGNEPEKGLIFKTYITRHELCL